MTDLDKESVPRALIAALMLTAMLNPLNSTMIAVALPAIAAAFGISGSLATTLFVTSYLIVNIALITPAGRLGDLLGRRRSLRLGQAILALGAIIGGLSPNLAGVVTGRILMAAGGAVVTPAVMAVIRGAFAPERRARLFASMGALMGIAAAVGPVLGGILTHRVGWQAIFLVNAPLLIVAGLFVRNVPIAPRRTDQHPERSVLQDMDVVGVGLLVIALGSLAVGLKSTLFKWGLLGVGAVLLAAFVLWERRATVPLLDLDLFRKRHFVAGGVAIALQNLSMYALLFQLPFLFEGAMELGPEQSGQLLVAMMATMVVMAPVGGFLSERIGVRNTVFLGLWSGTFGLLLGLKAIDDQAVLPLVGCLFGMGIGLGFVMGPCQAAALSSVSTRESGVASGVMATMRYLGGLMGVSIIAAVLVDVRPENLIVSHRLCLWFYLGAHILALLVATQLPKRVQAYKAPGATAS